MIAGTNPSAAGFKKLGVGARSAEIRSLIAARDARGKRFVLTRPQDHGARGYLLLTEVDSGKTTQYFNPESVRQGDNFGSILTSKGKFMYDQAGGHVLSFDVNSRETVYLGRPDPQNQHFMVYTEAPDGKVYLGGYPRASVTAYDPATGKFRNYGRMDDKEQYLHSIATDKNGFVYCGIGSARANIVALDPVSGKVIPLLPEAERKLGYGNVVAGDDGYVYARFGNYSVKLLDGKVVAENIAARPTPRNLLAPKYGGRLTSWDDGSRVMGCDLYRKELKIREADGKLRVLPFDYVSGGLEFTSIAAGPKGRIYGSTCHPMHFVELDSATGKITDHGPNPIVLGGNFCNMASSDQKVYACEYAGGRLWQYDPTRPIRFGTGMLTPFGATPEELAADGEAQNGHFSPLNSPPILFCNGKGDDAKFTLRLPVKTAGKYYLNVQFYEHANYGTVTLDFQGKSLRQNLQNLVDRPGAMQNLGPFELKPGNYPVVISVKANKNTKPWCGIVGAELSLEKRQGGSVEKSSDNPQILGRWQDLVTRPRAINIHPDGKHVVIAGFANYGLTGGGFGVHNLATGENRSIADWLPGQSCIAFRFLPNGDIVGGTSNEAPGGGYRKADEAAIFRVDWQTGKLVKAVPTPGSSNVVSVELWKGSLFAVTSDGVLYRLNPETLEILDRYSVAGGGTPPRNAFQKSADDRLFLLQANCIQEFNPATLKPVAVGLPASPITAGGACVNGKLYFACWTNYGEYQYPAKAPGVK